MISIEFLKTAPHKANAIDKRAIHNLIPHLQWEIQKDNISFNAEQKNELFDETNYIIVEIEGYENIAYLIPDENYILETVQPLDRENNKLFPIQALEIQVHYKRY